MNGPPWFDIQLGKFMCLVCGAEQKVPTTRVSTLIIFATTFWLQHRHGGSVVGGSKRPK